MSELTETVMAGDESSLLDHVQVVAENLRLLVLVPIAAGVLALGISFVVPPTFTASTKFMPPQQQQSAAAIMLQSLGALGGLAGGATSLKNPADQFVGLLKSRSVQDALVDRFELLARYDTELKQNARKELSANSAISSGKDGMITIEVDDEDPKFAANLANGYVEELGKLLNRLALTEAQQRRVFFEQELTKTKEQLVKAEQVLKSSGVNSSALKVSPQAAVEDIAKLKAAITVQEVKLASMRGYLTQSAPDFKQAQTELAALRSQLLRAEREDPAPGPGDSDYIAKFRDFKYQETLFELFAKQYEMARVDESREGAIVQVVDVAQPPERKSKPQKAVVAVLTTLVTGFAMMFFVFVRQALRDDPRKARKVASIRAALGSRNSRGVQ